MKYYGLYKITNLLNGKMYIGQHITANLDDGYMGSGVLIRRAVKKYGVENFRKEWLMFCEDEEELNYMERVFVDQTWIDRSDTYNMVLGGGCGWSFVNSTPVSEETKHKISIKIKGKPKSKEHKEKMRQAALRRWQDKEEHTRQSERIKAIATSERNSRISKSKTGKIWWTNGHEEKCQKEPPDNSWYRGRSYLK